MQTISRQAARRLIVLHPKQNIQSEPKWQICSGTMQFKLSCSSENGVRYRTKGIESLAKKNTIDNDGMYKIGRIAGSSTFNNH